MKTKMKITMSTAALALALSPRLASAQTTCGESIYEAESMFQSTGGAVTGGWNIWSNGHIGTDHNFQGGSTTFTVVARGQFANGVAPNMVVTVGGTQIYSTSVTSNNWAEYTFVADVDWGLQELRIQFTNDYYQNGEDRNLFVDRITIDECDPGWTDLTLLNGWQPEANSRTPQVGLINGVTTFRGALDGTAATSHVAFCLIDQAPGQPDYAEFRPEDVGFITMRGALANAQFASLTLSPAFPNDLEPMPSVSWCMGVGQDWAETDPGPDARVLTSLEGVSFDQTIVDSVKLDRAPGWSNTSPYPWRGSDSVTHPDGGGVFARIVDGFVRFQGVIVADSEDITSDLLFTMPPEMTPAQPAYVPVTLCPWEDPVPGRLLVQTNGDVLIDDAFDKSRCGVSLDGASYSIPPSSAQVLTLSNNWVPFASAPRVRLENGVIRLEGGVKSGTGGVIGTLPPAMRPSVDLFVVSNAFLLAQGVSLRIRTDGGIEILSPSVVAQDGVFLDGVSFALESFVCSGACSSATELSRLANSGSFNTTGEVWFVVDETVSGWQASEIDGRTITVNGVLVTSGSMPLPPAINGSYYFRFSAGDKPWASWSFW